MGKRAGSFRLAAAIRSLFSPGRNTVPAPEAPRTPRKRLWALVQTKPSALVLLVSDSRENLEAEAIELNETWNHRDLRTERHIYEIQPVALLQTGRDLVTRNVAQQPGQQQVG